MNPLGWIRIQGDFAGRTMCPNMFHGNTMQHGLEPMKIGGFLRKVEQITEK
jgi:hypothetical protein